MSALTEDTSPSGDDKSVGDTSGQPSTDSQTIRDRWESMSAEARKTWIFVGVAVACLAVTGLFELASRPAEIQEYGKLGQEFYPEFTDPTLATSLTVSVIDAEEVKPLSFSVKQAESGRWVIPSHHNYPADAADQLAETASSVIGIKRGAMVTRWASDHARYGVVNPETDSVGVDELEGIGKRLTLQGKDDTVLASYIIGKKVDGEDNQYYVRHPGEDETYIAELDISLSTKFGDWVNTDLLDIDSFDVRRVDLNDYSFDELRGTVTGKIESKLARESSSADWKMEGIDEKTQEVNKDAIGDTVNELANLELAGVRPKQPGLTADLKLDRSALGSQRDVDRLQSDLMSRGFLLQPSRTDPETLTLISREGEMSVGTEDGLVYQLHFGRVFTGSEKELEIGLTSDDEGDGPTDEGDDDESAGDKAAEDQAKAESTGDDEAETDEADTGEEDSDDSAGKEDADSTSKPGRYVFVRVDFDPTLLGDEPKPVEPEMPEELKEAEKKKDGSEDDSASEESDSDAGVEGEDSKEDEAGESDKSEKSDGEQSAEQESEEDKLEKIRDEYNDAKQKYQDDVKALEDFNGKVKEGKEKAEDLNRRFAQWYYVIPGDSFDKLSLSRDDLIKAKEKEEEEDSDDKDSTDGTSLAPPANSSGEAESKDAQEGDAGMKEADSEQAKATESEPETKEAAEDPKPDSEGESKADAEKETVKESSESAGKDKPEGDPEPTKEDKPDSGGDTPKETENPSEKGETDSSGDSTENGE
jgi:hypothetical protein